MEAKAKQSNIKMPARKIRRVINTVRGKGVEEAPIARGNAEKNKFKDLVREIFEVLKCV